jgi:hypothetical protein
MDNTTAYWIIDPQTIYDSITSITLTFTEFDLSSGDFVKVYDGESTSDFLLGSFTGTNLPPALTSSSNVMLVEFVTGSNGNASGFYAEYSSVSPSWCQGLTPLTEPSGTFDDGSGDFYYQSSATCMWRINPPNANKITLNFNYFDTEEGYDRVTVYDGTTLIAEFSGNEVPDPVKAYSGMMFITWNSNQSGNYQGWEAFYEVDNVGINDAPTVQGLDIYPNPATDQIQMHFLVKDKSYLKISLVNLTGQTLYTEEYPGYEGVYQQAISVSTFPAGLYFLEIRTLNGLTRKKILIN